MDSSTQTIDRHDVGDKLQFEVVSWGGTPGGWAVEATGEDGEIYQAFFYGPSAKERAEEYAAFKTDHQ